jgi:hypothetical protein
MLGTFEISFTVYYDEAKTQTDSNLSYLTTTVTAFMSQQAQAMIEATVRWSGTRMERSAALILTKRLLLIFSNSGIGRGIHCRYAPRHRTRVNLCCTGIR